MSKDICYLCKKHIKEGDYAYTDSEGWRHTVCPPAEPITEEGTRQAIRLFLEIYEKQGYTIQETEDLIFALCLTAAEQGKIEGRD